MEKMTDTNLDTTVVRNQMIKASELIKEIERADVVQLWSKELNAYVEVDIVSLMDAVDGCNSLYEFPLVISENEIEEESSERFLYLDPEGVNPDSKL